MTKGFFVVSALLSASLAFGSEPAISVVLSPNAVFASGSVIDVGMDAVETFDFVVSGSVAAIRPDSVSVRLNGNEIVGFARLSPTASGLRISMNRTSLDHPYVALAQAANDLQLAARDTDGNVYRGRWAINATAGAEAAIRAGIQATPPPAIELRTVAKPEIRFPGGPPSQRDGSKHEAQAVVHFEVTDARGVRAVFIYVNGREIEAIQMRNGFPSRRRGNFRRSGELPGTVAGGSRALEVEVPVPLPKATNTVTISVRNMDGYEQSETISITRRRN